MTPMRRLVAPLIACAALLAPVPAHAATAHATSAPAVRAPSAVAKPIKLVKVGTLRIPRLRLTQPIYKGITMYVFDRGMGQWPGTAAPGKVGNMVIGGHRTGGSMPLYYIDKLKRGDKIFVTAKGKTHKYKVTGARIVSPKAVWITKQSRAKTLTLFACHPLHSIAKRWIVSAVLVP